MSEPFVLQSGNGSRWVLYPPEDPYGDGYVLALPTELRGDGMTAAAVVELDGIFVSPHTARLSAFFGTLAADRRGWEGVRQWTSARRQLTLEAAHDGVGRVSLGVTLRAADTAPAFAPWSATLLFGIEASRELPHLARRLSDFLEAEP
ncbi:hypothetical protein E1193_06645 [Micromonospora sp. KC606]|uniref:DUF6228 family protein n=1 Tax=Micromonospora sp. KC606 TaxID=2530379 RepID=UPI001042A311|nr:DUF6228 family protein [Micromonospora sp. KC606]TDC84080.1 hypothetical protein E1193_06645 [Micromonospora sp. KC606]